MCVCVCVCVLLLLFFELYVECCTKILCGKLMSPTKIRSVHISFLKKFYST